MIFIFGHLVPIYLSLFLLFVLFYLYYDFWLHFICSPRLLHSPSLVVIGLVGYETWPPIDWHPPIVISWFKYRLGLFSVVLCAHGTSGSYHRFSDSSDSPLHRPNGRQMTAVRAVHGERKFIPPPHSVELLQCHRDQYTLAPCQRCNPNGYG